MTWRTSLWLAFRGGRSDRLRIALTAASTALSAFFVLLSAAFLGAASDGPGAKALAVWRVGLAGPAALALFLLALVSLGLAVECGRVGEPVRRRRVRDLTLLGAGHHTLRRLAALEGGVTSVAGVVAGAAAYGLLALTASRVGGPYGVWDTAGHRVGWAWDPDVRLLPTSLSSVWEIVVPGLLLLPVLVTLGAFVLGLVGATGSRVARPGFRGSLALVVLSPALMAAGAVAASRVPGGAPATAATAVAAAAACVALARGSLGLVGASSRALGGLLAGRARTPATLLAARRMSDGEARGGGVGALLVGCVLGGGAVGLHALQMAGVARGSTAGNATPWSVVVILLGVAVATIVGSIGLTVREVEAIVSRRRSLATAVAAGVPRGVLRRAAVLESVLPVLPLVVVGASLGAIGVQALAAAWWGVPPVSPLPGLALLVLFVMSVAGLAAALATLSLPASTDISEARVPA